MLYMLHCPMQGTLDLVIMDMALFEPMGARKGTGLSEVALAVL